MVNIKYNKDLTRILRDEMPTSSYRYEKKSVELSKERSFATAITSNPRTVQKWEADEITPSANDIARICEYALRRNIKELPIWIKDNKAWNYSLDDSLSGESIIYNQEAFRDIKELSKLPTKELAIAVGTDEHLVSNGLSRKRSNPKIDLVGRIYFLGLQLKYRGKLWLPKYT